MHFASIWKHQYDAPYLAVAYYTENNTNKTDNSRINVTVT